VSTTLAKLLRQHFRRQERQALAALKAGAPWPVFDADVMAESLEAPLLPVFLRGARRTARDIGEAVKDHARRTRSLPIHSPVAGRYGFCRGHARVEIDEGSDIAPFVATVVRAAGHSFAARLFRNLFPHVAAAVRRLTLTFCAETNRTSRHELAKARQLLREELEEGLEEGEALVKLTARVRRIFAAPRAYDIARTESARAIEAGGMLAAQASGVVRAARWLTAPDSCDACQELDGKEVPLGTPFVVLPGGGPYAVVYHPGLHPSCRCSVTYVAGE